MLALVGVAAVVASVAALARPPRVAGDQLSIAGEGIDAVIAKYQARIPELMADQHVPGVSIALVDGDRVLWTQGFGHVDGPDSAAVGTDTMFSLQSMTKLFTATAVMQAAGQGLVDLDVPITTYLADFTVHSAFEDHPERKITLRMLLAHTAGFSHEAPVGNNDSVDPGTFDEHVQSIVDTWLRFPVGTGFAYSNLGIDLAGYILEKVEGKPFADVMRDTLLKPLGMDHSTLDRAQIRSTADRAVGHNGGTTARQIDVPMTAAGGLYSSASDLARFLRFELNDGSIDGHVVLDPKLLDDQRTIPAPNAGDSEGYALGVSRTCWHVARNTDLFNHGGGGWGFLSDLWFAPKLGLGIAVLTNSSDNQLQTNLAISIMGDLIDEPGSVFGARLAALPQAVDAGAFSGDWVPPTDLPALIAKAAIAPTAATPTTEQAARWASYEGAYKSTSWGFMDPTTEPERFAVESGVPYFDGVDQSQAYGPHRLTEVRPGIFLADDGETLDFTGAVPTWRNLELVRVTGGPVAWQWVLLGAADIVALLWLGSGLVGSYRGRRRDAESQPRPPLGRPRRVAALVGTLTVAAILASTALVVVIPGLVDSGFLGWLEMPLALRLLFHLPLALALLAAILVAMTAMGWARAWWPRSPRFRSAPLGYVALAVAAVALTAQLAAWHLIGWGLT